MVTCKWFAVTWPVNCVWSWSATASASDGNDLWAFIACCFGTPECTESWTNIGTPHLSNFEKVKKKFFFFEMWTEFFVATQVVLRPTRLPCVCIRISTEFLICLYSWPSVYLISTCAKWDLAAHLPQSSCCLRRGVPVVFFPCFPMFQFIQFSVLKRPVSLAWNVRETTREVYFYRNNEEPLLFRGGVSV